MENVKILKNFIMLYELSREADKKLKNKFLKNLF